MADVHKEDIRRKNMQAIRYKNTKPEILVRQLLHARGFRFRLNVRTLPGSPDIVLSKYKAAVFVNGCFWHGHDCYLFKLPGTRREFWETKINTNRARDDRARRALLESGWRVLIIWECAVKGRLRQPQEDMIEQVADWLRADDTEAGFLYGEVRCLEEKVQKTVTGLQQKTPKKPISNQAKTKLKKY